MRRDQVAPRGLRCGGDGRGTRLAQGSQSRVISADKLNMWTASMRRRPGHAYCVVIGGEDCLTCRDQQEQRPRPPRTVRPRHLLQPSRKKPRGRPPSKKPPPCSRPGPKTPKHTQKNK